MSESEAMLHEANRRAHKVARLGLKWRQLHIESTGDEPRLDALVKLDTQIQHALDAYEEIEKRQRKEATL